MRTLNDGYRGMSLLLRLNRDVLLWGGSIAAALWVAGQFSVVLY